ncbi:MAG: hypothetical protein KDD15_26285, partial [Lewinella sp.]|nr:hypothetical protein [Lewinella sp.]
MQPFTTFPFQSPVHLFPEDQLDRIDKIDFEVLRRELLRRLSRSGQTKLNIHQLEYDQQAIIAGLEDFQRSPEQHLRLYRNKPLLAFLETGEATFFETPESWEDVYDPAFQNWLEPYFTARYEYMMYRCVSEKGFLSLNRLRLIDSSKFELPAAYRDRSYQKAFTFLQEMLREARQKTSFTREKKNDLYRIDPIASKYIIPHFMHVFRHLPPYFQPLTTEYINYVHTLFSTAFQKDVAFKTDVLDLFEHSSLVTLSHAAKIIAHHMNKPNLHQFGEMINHYLAENAQNESEEKAIAIYKLSMYAVAFIAFLVICFKYCGKRSNDPADQKAGIETPKADQTIPDVLSVLEGAWYTTTS